MHIQRFFSYLSLFTFMMLILVTADNYLLMFVGWEGNHNRLKWLNIWKYNNFCTNSSNIRSDNHDSASLIIGSLLGNSYMEKNEKGVRIVFVKCSNNIEYLMKFHSFLIDMGYCKNKKPKLNKVISKHNKVFYYIVIQSFYLTKFEIFYTMFYVNSLKTIPLNLKEYLTPLSLTTWYLDNTDKLYVSSDQCFYLKSNDLEFISKIIQEKFNVKTVHRLESIGKVALYIENTDQFRNVIKPYITPSLDSKLNNPYNKLALWNNIKSPLRKISDFNGLTYNSIRNYSTSMNNIKYSTKYKKEFVLSDIQKESLIGIILGDGFVDRAKSKYNTRIRLEQSYPEKSEYLKSLYELFEPLVAMEPTLLTRENKKTGVVTKSLYFRTLAMPCLNYYHELFYKDGVKIVPQNLTELLTARGLAYWIMDDGGKSIYNQTILHTRSFSKQEVEYLQFVLNQNFGLKTRLEEKKQDQWVIYIPVRQTQKKLKDIVGPYMHKSMLYKI